MVIKNPMYVKMGIDIGDTTATAADVLAGKDFYLANGTKTTGQIVTYTGALSVTPSENAQTLATNGKYMEGDVEISPIPSQYKDTTGTDAVAGEILAGKKAVTGAGLVTGTIPTYAGSKTVTPSENTQTLATENKYVNGDIVVNSIPSNYKDTTGTDATASDILSGKKAVTGAGMITGNYVPPSPTLITKNITANGTYNAENDNADGYSEVVVNVSGVVVEEKDVNFYDYDGTLVASYSAADFANLSAMPANPSHTGLVADGWNYTLADAKTYVAAYGKLNIGQMYHTASGKTEYDIEVNEATGMTATLGLSGTQKDWGDGTVNTNTTHTYATAGSYTIKLSGTTLPSIASSKKVRAVRIASGVTSIVQVAFRDCWALQSVTIPSSVTNIGQTSFYDCYSLQSVTIPSGVTSAKNSLFYNCYSLQSVTIPSSVTSTGTSAFRSCSSLQSATIPSSVTDIAGNAFRDCYSLQSVTIPSSVTSIGSNAFQNCYALQSATLQSGVTSIGSYAFYNCYSLQPVTIPSSVTSIGDSAFYNCYLLTIVTVLAATPPALSNANAFPSEVTKIYIPNGTLTAYQTATNWASFSSKFVELPA